MKSIFSSICQLRWRQQLALLLSRARAAVVRCCYDRDTAKTHIEGTVLHLFTASW